MESECQHPGAERELVPHGAGMVFEYYCTRCGAYLFRKPYSWLRSQYAPERVTLHPWDGSEGNHLDDHPPAE